MKKYSEIISGVVLFALSTVYFWMAFSIKQFNAGQPGIVTSDFMPKIYGMSVMILSAIQTLRGVRDLKRGEYPGAGEEVEECEGRKWKLPVQPEILLTFLFLVLYVALLERVGFIIMSVLFILGIAYVLLPYDKRTKKMFLIVFVAGTVFTVAITMIFVYGFSLTIPMGIFG